MNIWQRIISKHWRTFITLIYVLPSWHTSTGTGAINVVTGDIIQTVSTLKQTAFSIIPIIAFLKGKTKQNNKKNTQRNKHVNRQRKTEIDKHRFIVSWFVLQIFIYRKLYSFSYQSNLWQKLQNTINIKKNLRSSHLLFWNPFAHLLQFPKKELQTSLLWQWSLHRKWQFRPYSPGLHAKITQN